MRQHKGKYSMHKGIDFAAPIGTEVKAAKEGIIENISTDTGYGKCIVINHGNNLKTRYAHLSKIQVVKNEKVSNLQTIGRVGATGNVRGKKSGAHLHFEVIYNNKRLNPIHHLPQM